MTAPAYQGKPEERRLDENMNELDKLFTNRDKKYSGQSRTPSYKLFHDMEVMLTSCVRLRVQTGAESTSLAPFLLMTLVTF